MACIPQKNSATSRLQTCMTHGFSNSKQQLHHHLSLHTMGSFASFSVYCTILRSMSRNQTVFHGQLTHWVSEKLEICKIMFLLPNLRLILAVTCFDWGNPSRPWVSRASPGADISTWGLEFRRQVCSDQYV